MPKTSRPAYVVSGSTMPYRSPRPMNTHYERKTGVEEYEQKMMEYIFASQVLILANQLRSARIAKGEEVKSDMIPEAIQMLKKKSVRIFEHMNILS